MRENNVKKKLKNGETIFGTMIKEACNITVVDALEQAGFDFFVIDSEHCPYTIREAANILQYALKTGITGIIRVPKLEYSHVARALDAGAEGIWVPHVDSAEEAAQLVNFAKYPPKGARGAAVPVFRTNYFKEFDKSGDYFAWANEQTLLIAQIESGQAVRDIDEIVSVPGIDVAMMGCLDLSLDIGCPGQRKHPDVRNAVQKVVDSCARKSVVSGNHLGDLEELQYWMGQGMRMITYSYEVNLMIDRGREVLKQLRSV